MRRGSRGVAGKQGFNNIGVNFRAGHAGSVERTFEAKLTAAGPLRLGDLLLAEVPSPRGTVGRQTARPQRLLVELGVGARGEEEDDLARLGRTGVDELMVVTMAHSHADRLRSYELLMDAALAEPIVRSTTVGAR